MSTTASPLAPRADFPALADHNYLNSASISIMAKPVREAMERLTRRILHAGTVSLDEEAEVQALEIAREPVFVGWRGTADMWGFDATELTYAPSLRRFEFSTMSYMSGYGLGEALRYVHSLGVKSIFDHDLGLAGQLIEGLERLGARALTPREPSRRSGIVTARFPGRNGEKMAAELNRRKVVVSPRFGSTRFSPHFFNGSDEIEQALSVLAGIL